MRRLIPFTLILLLAGCARVPDGPSSRTASHSPRQCFDVNRVENFRSAGFDQLYVRTRPERAVYALSGVGCGDLDLANQLGLVSDGVGGRIACVGDFVRVINPTETSSRSVCRMRIDRRLTPEDVEALPSRQRP